MAEWMAQGNGRVRQAWVDTTRGWCMLAIILNHTDIYLVGDVCPIVSFDLFGTNALMTFFVVSGYLFYRGDTFSLRRKVWSEFRHLVVPYFLFTLAMSVPKALAWGYAIDVRSILLTIVCGQASWFVAARAIAGLLFSVLITLSLRCRWWLLPLSCALLAAVPFAVDSPLLHLWNVDIALMSLVYLCLGYLFHAYESALISACRRTYVIAALAIVVVLKGVEQYYGFAVPVSPERITSFPLFFVDTVLAAGVIIAVCRRYCALRVINYVGRNSIVYYFLCGGVPLLVGRAFRAVGLTYRGNYLVVLLAFVVVVALLTLCTFVITRYLPFMTGRRRRDVPRATY